MKSPRMTKGYQHMKTDTKWPPFRIRHFQMHFLKWECLTLSIKIPPKFVPKDPIESIPALVHIMTWRRTGDEPLSEPIMAYVADAYMRHFVSMS